MILMLSGCIIGENEANGAFSNQPAIINVNDGKTGVESFAQCLTDNGVKMYGTEWCSHCKNQKKLFGDAFNNVDYIDCDKYGNLCDDADIEGYPTWNVNGENYPGEQSFERLAYLSGCEFSE